MSCGRTCGISGPSHAGGSIFKVNSEPIKQYILHKLGHPHVRVEITDDQLNDIIRVGGDFIATYFPREQRIATFYTIPLQSTYKLPADAWQVEEVNWDPFIGNIYNIFGVEYQLMNNAASMLNTGTMVLDYHMLQHYRKHTSKIMGSEGRWEVINEVPYTSTGDELNYNKQLLRLFPTPKATYPVVVVYMPCVSSFRKPAARQLTYDLLVAEAKISVGMARRKIQNIPTPDGGQLSLDGEAMVNEGEQKKKEIMETVMLYGEPMPIITA